MLLKLFRSFDSIRKESLWYLPEQMKPPTKTVQPPPVLAASAPAAMPTPVVKDPDSAADLLLLKRSIERLHDKHVKMENARIQEKEEREKFQEEILRKVSKLYHDLVTARGPLELVTAVSPDRPYNGKNGA